MDSDFEVSKDSNEREVDAEMTESVEKTPTECVESKSVTREKGAGQFFFPADQNQSAAADLAKFVFDLPKPGLPKPPKAKNEFGKSVDPTEQSMTDADSNPFSFTLGVLGVVSISDAPHAVDVDDEEESESPTAPSPTKPKNVKTFEQECEGRKRKIGGEDGEPAVKVLLKTDPKTGLPSDHGEGVVRPRPTITSDSADELSFEIEVNSSCSELSSSSCQDFKTGSSTTGSGTGCLSTSTSSSFSELNINSECLPLPAKSVATPPVSMQATLPNISVLLPTSAAKIKSKSINSKSNAEQTLPSHIYTILPINSSRPTPVSTVDNIVNPCPVNLVIPFKVPMTSTPVADHSEDGPTSAKVPKLEKINLAENAQPVEANSTLNCAPITTSVMNSSPQQIYIQRNQATSSPCLSSCSESTSSSSDASENPNSPMELTRRGELVHPTFADLEQCENEPSDLSEPVAFLKLSDAILQGSSSPQIARVAQTLKISTMSTADTRQEQSPHHLETSVKPTIQFQYSSPATATPPQQQQAINPNFGSGPKQASNINTRSRMAPPQVIPTVLNPPRSAPAAPRMVQFVNLPYTPKNTMERGSVILPAKGTPHPTQGIYMPQGPSGQLKYQSIHQPQTPTGLIIRSSVPRQRFELNSGISPHASPASLSLNSSGEENSGTSPEDVTPPPRVPYNTPLSGLPHPRFPLFARLLNNPNILSNMSNVAMQSMQYHSSPDEGSECSPPLQRSVGLVRQSLPIPENDYPFEKDHHNAKERRRRARIKDASNRLREIVPGLTSKTDKATALEFAVEYILFMKQNMSTRHMDREFLDRCNPY